MFKNIMLPIDGSPFSELALPLAMHMARRSNARLHIVCVHVPPVPTAEVMITEDYDTLVRDWESAALDATRARAAAADLQVNAALLDGPVVESLQYYAEAAAIDLVVMCTHGRSGLKRAVLGSVAEQCVRNSDVPVLLVHPESDHADVTASLAQLKKIVVGLDGSAEAEAVLPHVLDIARLAGASITLGRITVPPFDVAMTVNVEALKNYLIQMREQAEIYLQAVRRTLPRDQQVECIAKIAEGTPQGILRLAAGEQADMIAMATRGRSGWSRFKTGSIAESVLRQARTPVLLVKALATARTSEVLRSMRSEPVHFGDSG